MRDIEKIKKALVSHAFAACQPNNGDVFGWIDDHAGELADVVLAASEIPLLLEMIKIEREVQAKIIAERDKWFRETQRLRGVLQDVYGEMAEAGTDFTEGTPAEVARALNCDAHL